MARFKRLTVDEARTLTRAELLDRLETEGDYWSRKLKHGTPQDWADYRVYQQCMRLIDPAKAIRDTTEWLNGKPGAGGYMDRRPCDDTPVQPVCGCGRPAVYTVSFDHGYPDGVREHAVCGRGECDDERTFD